MKKTYSKSILKTTGGLIGLAVMFVILAAINIILGNVKLRKDITEDKLYSLSDGTKTILANLDQNVTLKLFFNSSNPRVPVSLKNYARQVEDLLHEYKMANPRRISIEKYDPKPDSDAEEWAQKYGLNGQPMEMFGPPLYFGVVASAGAQEQVIPALDPRTEELLEYNITHLIYKTIHPEKPAIGVISALQVLNDTSPMGMMKQQGSTKPSWLAFQQLQQDYDVINVPADAKAIDPAITALIIVHPKEFSDTTMYAIDQFLMRGGKIMAFLDPISVVDLETTPPQPYRVPKASSNMEKMLKAWGVDYNPTQVLADMNAVSRIQTGNGQIEDSPVWMSLRQANMSKDDLLTAKLDSVMMPFAGTFACNNLSKDLTATPLITSSQNAGLVHFMNAQYGSEAIHRNFQAEGKALNIAVRITGTFKTAFPEGAPKEEAKSEENKNEQPPAGIAPLKEGKSAVILAGDSDMIYDRFCVQELNFFGTKAYQPLNDNINFFFNAVEQITGSTDLIAIRSRGKFERPFDRVIQLEQKAQSEWREKEKTLTEKLAATQQQLNQMQTQKGSDQRFILSQEQKQAIDSFRNEEVRIKEELKDVRKNLRKDIEQLGVWVKFINIALMPILVSMAGITFGIYRKIKR